ncbi:MAG: DUF1559 domain-containing protein, partial [Planctomycetales bacterium]
MSANNQHANEQPAIEKTSVDSPPDARRIRFTLASVFGVTLAFAVCFALWFYVGAPLGTVAILLVLMFLIRRTYQTRERVLLECWAVVLVLGFGFFGFMVMFVQRTHRRPARIACGRYHLKNILLAMHTYESVHGALPPPYLTDASGKRAHSWRTMLLPYLEMQDVHKRVDVSEPWDGPNNTLLRQWLNQKGRTPEIYACPACSDDDPNPFTNYVAVIGPGTAWDPKGRRKLS